MGYKIILSENMLKQKFKPIRKTFKTENQAYMFGIQKWGSGAIGRYGWTIKPTGKSKLKGWY